MQRAFSLELKSINETGEFEGYASTYDQTPDSYGDVVAPGSFARTLSTAGKERPLLLEHREPVGTVILSDSPAGLVAKGRISLGLQKGAEAYLMLKDRIVKGLSIGFETVKSSYVGETRILEEIRLWEVSLTVFPANQNAMVTAVKSSDLAILRAAIRDYHTVIVNALKG